MIAKNWRTLPIMSGVVALVVATLLFGAVQVNALPLAQSASQNAAIVFALDTSESMLGVPLQSSKDATISLLQELHSSVPVAIVSYSESTQLIQAFSTERTSLEESILALNARGRTALYDGVMLAVETASAARQTEKIVIVVGDGAEYGGLSKSLRDDTIRVAVENGVTVYTVGIGVGIDNDYFLELSEVSGGKMFSAPRISELPGVYEVLLEQIEQQIFTSPSAPTFAESEPTIGDIASVEDLVAVDVVSVLPSLDNAPRADADTEDTQISFASVISSIDDAIIGLNLSEAAAFASNANIDVVTLSDAAAGESPVTLPNVESARGVDLLNEMIPIRVSPSNPESIVEAQLLLNDQLIATFDSAPYEYDLDSSRLEAGLYRLMFTVTYLEGNTAADYSEFEFIEVSTADNSTTLRVFDGADRDELVFDFNAADGLNMVRDEALGINEPILEESNATVMAILLRPVTDIIPAEWSKALFQPRPFAASLIVMLMMITLVPQAVFTLIWMLYTWNNPEIADEFSTPKTYEAPQYSFTALVPARKEHAVIYDTIKIIDQIDYPSEMKEILVLVRDDGQDDDTLAEVDRAQRDLGYNPNIRLITFNDGPFNKPNGLNRGFAEGTGDVFGIFDAEDQPHPDIYNIINTTMLRKEADVVQSGVQLMTYFGKNGNEPWFAALNVLEYFFWFKSGLHCFTREFGVTPLGGNTVFAKREWLQEVGFEHNRKDEGHDILEVWDENCLTEDADLGIRLTNIGANIEIVYSAEHATREETPATTEQFIKQRTRWNQGFFEVFSKGDWIGMRGIKRKVVATYILLNSVMQALLVLYLPVGIFVAFTQEIPVPIAILSYVPIYLLIMQLVTQMVGIREYASAYRIKMPLGFRLKMLASFYPYQLLLGLSAARAVLRFIAGTSNWEKTEHSGAHRQSSRTTVVAPAARTQTAYVPQASAGD